MKIVGGLLVGITLVAVGIAARDVSAAACANTSSFGAVTLTVPKLDSTEDQVIWIRLQAANKDAKVLAEINGKECMQVGGNLQPNVWSWQTQVIGGVVQPVNFATPTENTVKIIGVNDGVKVDRVLITDQSCNPQDFGNACKSGVELSQSTDSTVVELAPFPDQPVHGKITLSTTPFENQDNLKQVSYMAGGKVLQVANEPEQFDTTLLPNGKHTIYITTELQEGGKIRESMVIEIKNPENAISSIVRWARLNRKTLNVVGLAVLGLIALFVFANIASRAHKKRKHRKFHGF